MVVGVVVITDLLFCFDLFVTVKKICDRRKRKGQREGGRREKEKVRGKGEDGRKVEGKRRKERGLKSLPVPGVTPFFWLKKR